jgi:hypothetical protein
VQQPPCIRTLWPPCRATSSALLLSPVQANVAEFTRRMLAPDELRARRPASVSRSLAPSEATARRLPARDDWSSSHARASDAASETLASPEQTRELVTRTGRLHARGPRAAERPGLRPGGRLLALGPVDSPRNPLRRRAWRRLRHALPHRLAALGRLGAEREATLRTWFDHGMDVEGTARSLHMHPNTPQAAAASRRRPTRTSSPWPTRSRAVVGARAQAAGVQGSGRDMKVRVYKETRSAHRQRDFHPP